MACPAHKNMTTMLGRSASCCARYALPHQHMSSHAATLWLLLLLLLPGLSVTELANISVHSQQVAS
jgi:hypothetical protein